MQHAWWHKHHAHCCTQQVRHWSIHQMTYTILGGWGHVKTSGMPSSPCGIPAVTHEQMPVSSCQTCISASQTPTIHIACLDMHTTTTVVQAPSVFILHSQTSTWGHGDMVKTPPAHTTGHVACTHWSAHIPALMHTTHIPCMCSSHNTQTTHAQACVASFPHQL